MLIYATAKGINVELRFDGDTFWATQSQMAEMFGVDRTSITKHLGNIYDEGELEKAATCEETSQVRKEGQRTVQRAQPIYNLNAMISVGYRVNSKQGTMFRIWATERLVQILTKGFYVGKERLKNQGTPDVLDEFREIAREIRTSILGLSWHPRHPRETSALPARGSRGSSVRVVRRTRKIVCLRRVLCWIPVLLAPKRRARTRMTWWENF